MKKGLKKGAVALLVTSMSTMTMSGCVVEKLDLVSEEEPLIIEYAVDAVLNHDKNYIVKLADRIVEEETTTWVSDPSEVESTPSEEESTEEETEKYDNSNTISVNSAFALNGFDVQSTGYSIVDKYPADMDTFGIVANKGNKLLVMEFNVTNTSAGTLNLDMPSLGYKYKCVINKANALNAQVTLLLNGFNTWKGEFVAGQTEHLALVFQVPDEIVDTIENVELTIVKADDKASALIRK